MDRLVEKGAQVRVLDDLSTGDKRNLNPDAEFIYGDIRNEKVVQQALKGVDIVFHHAAQINPAKAVEEPVLDFEINVMGTLVLLINAYKVGVKRFLMASTNLYGDANLQDMPENIPVLALEKTLLSPYAAAKAAAEAYLKVFNDEFGLPTVRLRYTNVYGPRQLTKSESGVVAIFTRGALRDEPLVIFGDGTQTRDFVYVSDVVQANIKAAEVDQAVGQVFNIGAAIETSINNLAKIIKGLLRSKSKIVSGPHRSADFRHVKVNLSNSARMLGFKSTVSLKDGLLRYTDWCRKNMDRL